MFRSSIVILIFVAFVSLIHIGFAKNNIPNKTGKSGSINIIGNCAIKKCIHKCCPFGEYVKKAKVCGPAHLVGDFQEMKVYNKDMENTGKTVRDVFTIIPGRFNDKEFHTEARVSSLFGFVPYIIENGILQVELPNSYSRWTIVDSVNFCVDYSIINSNNTSLAKPHFWARIVVEESMQNQYTFLTYAMIVSSLFILIVLVVYILLPELQNQFGLILMAYLANLLLSFLLSSTISLFYHSATICKCLTCGIYFFFLASFFWLNIMSYDIWWTFRNDCNVRSSHRTVDRSKLFKYSLYAWGVPLLMTIGLGVLNEVNMEDLPWFITPDVPGKGCYLDESAKMLYLDVPMTILVVINGIFYLITVYKIWQSGKKTAILDSAALTSATNRRLKQRLMVYLKLSVVMGLNWVLEFIGFFFPSSFIWYTCRSYNMLIGMALFFIFVCKKSILIKLQRRFQKQNPTSRFLGASENSSLNTTPSKDKQKEDNIYRKK